MVSLSGSTFDGCESYLGPLGIIPSGPTGVKGLSRSGVAFADANECRRREALPVLGKLPPLTNSARGYSAESLVLQ